MTQSASALGEYKSFRVFVEGHIGRIEFSRPESLNSMNVDFWLELPKAARALESDNNVRVIVIASTGKHFSAGMDLSVFQNPKTLPMTGDPGRVGENLRRTVLQLQDCLSVLEQVRVPVLTAVHGACVGGAVDLICASDSRYCTANAYFTIKETEIGMTADMGTLQRLPKLIPEGMARELAYTGRKFDAQEALRLGFVNAVFDDHESLLAGVLEVAAQIAKNSPLAVTGCKEMINYARDHSVEDSLKYMANWQSGMFRPQDMMLAFAAQAQKKQAEYPPLFEVRPVFSHD